VSTDTKKERWLGGTIRWGKRGPSYVIERWIDGKHWHLSTKCRTERAALKELERFEAAPAEYRRARGAKSQGLQITPDLVAEYLTWMRAEGLSRGHIIEHERYVGQFLVAMAGRDLRRMGFVALRDLIDTMGTTARWNRVKAVKAFASWLRRHKGLLPRAEDPTLDLLNPVQTPEKNRRRKAMSLATVEAAIDLMPPEVADIAIVLAATGLHISEVIRFHAGEGGLYEPADWQRADNVLMNMMVQHKSGKRHVVAVTDQGTLEALRRIQARPALPHRSSIGDSDRKVSVKLGVKFSMGWLRHSVASWLAMGRVSEQEIANQLGHSSTRMAHSTYIDLGMTARPVPIPRLKLVKG
jgi:integrase